MKERNAAAFGSFGALSDFYRKENPEQRARERAEKRKKTLVDETALRMVSDTGSFYDRYRTKVRREAEIRRNRAAKEVELLDETKLAESRASANPPESYLSLFLPCSPKALRIKKMMSEYDAFAAGGEKKTRRAKKTERGGRR